MLAIKPEPRLALGDEITIQAIPELDHYYAFNIKNGDHFQLNHTACWVLEAIGGGLRVTDLIGKYAEEFEMHPETARDDLAEVIHFALDNSIIMEVSDEKEKGLTKL